MRPETTKDSSGNKFSNCFKGTIQKKVSIVIFSLRKFEGFQNLKMG
jgi:hypothetical protein